MKTFITHNHIFSNLGFDSETVVAAISEGISGLQIIENPILLAEPFCASIIPSEKIKNEFRKIDESTEYTRLEQMMILSLQKIIDAAKLPLDEKVGLIISTTKGNIDVLETENRFPKERAYLSKLGKVVQNFFHFKNEPIVLSNACVSGLLAVSVAKRFILEGKYQHVFITSGDIVSKFILSGFSSFQALSPEPCKPFDKNRAGINLGEVAASVLVTSEERNQPVETVEILGDGGCNDANHISGPSRTGEGLYRSVLSAMKEAEVSVSEIDYISAHGTATAFNDEMEAIAFNRLGMAEIPLNSLKGYFGHTLGASGLLETIVGMHSLRQNMLFESKGFDEIGVSKPIYVIKKKWPKELDLFLKTASGFGGCNTALIFRKHTTKNNL